VSTPRFFVPDVSSTAVALSPEDSRHALRSLRLRTGDPVSLADGRGMVAEGSLRGTADGIVTVELEERHPVQRRGPVVSVALAPPKGERLAWAIQKMSELGVDEAVLVRAERSVREWGEERATKAVARLAAVAREAAMQSRQAFVMEVRPPVTLEEALQAGPAEVVVLWEGSDQALSTHLPEAAGGIRLLVGPEGGFADGEVEAMQASGAALASLGPSILRTETAAVVGAALVLARYGRLG
jgi:16S rRNA (uracil1498-N3)-methyltransferase